MTSIVVPALKLAYIHIPKTAGTSISCWLLQSLRKKNIEVVDFGHSHQSLNELNLPDDYKIISSIRNPWDRIVSIYSYAKAIEEKYPKKIFLLGIERTNDQFPSFDQWIKNIQNYTLNVDAVNYFDGPTDDGHWPTDKFWWNLTTPQSNWLQRDPDVLIKFENLIYDLQPLEDMLSIKINLPHEKQSNHINYKSYYDNTSIDIISKYYAADIARWNYSF